MSSLLQLARWRRRIPRKKGSPHQAHTRGFWPLVARTRLSSPVRHPAGPFTAILLMHRRPPNADVQVRLALQTAMVSHVVVSNNNPEIDVHDFVRIRSPRLTLRNDPGRNQVRRYAVALETGAEHFILIDDDIFLAPATLDSLCQRFVADQASPTGLWGQRLHEGDTWESGIAVEGARVDVLNRGYLCTRRHATRVFELAEALAWSDEELYSHPADDVLLSFSGEEPARVTTPVEFVDCPSHNERSISTFRQAGFHTLRAGWVRQLRAITGISGIEKEAAGDDGAER